MRNWYATELKAFSCSHIPHAIYSHSVTSHLISWEQYDMSRGNELLNTDSLWAYLAPEAPTSLDNQKCLEKKYWAKMDAELGEDPKGYFPN